MPTHLTLTKILSSRPNQNPPFVEETTTQRERKNRVQGCVHGVWLSCESGQGRLTPESVLTPALDSLKFIADTTGFSPP